MLACGCALVHVALTRLPPLLTHIYQNVVLEVGASIYYRLNQGSKRPKGEEEGGKATGAGEVSSITQTTQLEEVKLCGRQKKENVDKEGREEGEGEETVGEGRQGEAQAQPTHETQVHHNSEAQVRLGRKGRCGHVCFTLAICVSPWVSPHAPPCVCFVCQLGCGGGCAPCRAAADPHRTTARTHTGTHHRIGQHRTHGGTENKKGRRGIDIASSSPCAHSI